MVGAAQFNTSGLVKRSAIASLGYGLTGEYAFCKSLSLQTGLEIIAKGSNLRCVEIAYLDYDQNAAGYLEIPVLLKYGWKHVFCGAGPFIARGIGGNISYQRLELAPHPIKWGDLSGDDQRRTDFGLRLEIGLHFGHFRVGTMFDQGMTNILPVPGRSSLNKGYRTETGGIWCGYVF
jgi:hypothetical protein